MNMSLPASQFVSAFWFISQPPLGRSPEAVSRELNVSAAMLRKR
jgi:hypothetical protein